MLFIPRSPNEGVTIGKGSSRPYRRGNPLPDSQRRMRDREERELMRPVSVNALRDYQTASASNPRLRDERTPLARTKVSSVLISKTEDYPLAVLYSLEDGAIIIALERVFRLSKPHFQLRLMIVGEAEYVDFSQAQLEWDEMVDSYGREYSRSGADAYQYLRVTVTQQKNDRGGYMYSAFWRTPNMTDVDIVLVGGGGWHSTERNKLMSGDKGGEEDEIDALLASLDP